MIRKTIAIVLVALCFIGITVSLNAQNNSGRTFTNPLRTSGPDPWVIQKDGLYYFCRTTGSNLQLIVTPKMSELANAQSVIVWTPPDTGMYAKELWAPELHYLNHKWYLYFAADDGNNDHHRMYVLENSDKDPTTGNWVFKGKIADKTDKWAIDGSVFTLKGTNYMIWSGWEGDDNVSQNIYIAEMSDPWTIKGDRVMLSTPTYDWERKGMSGGLPAVNEGPEILKGPNGDLFLTYSASGCWTDHYALGMLKLKKGGNPMRADNWIKSDRPVFASSEQNGVYAPGHNGFFKSPDGKQDWIIYHANDKPGQGCGNYRSPRMQQFHWKADGNPDFGIPVKKGIALPVPSGN
ncbi:MAG TPA: glycoside hydrolase family 43 protein [Arachidicoccus sp.]|nr:glycoside hydrolase family 43 protein [Arachidicoccus sp.]